MTMEQIGQRRGLRGQRWIDYFARRFRECLDGWPRFMGSRRSGGRLSSRSDPPWHRQPLIWRNMPSGAVSLSGGKGFGRPSITVAVCFEVRAPSDRLVSSAQSDHAMMWAVGSAFERANGDAANFLD